MTGVVDRLEKALITQRLEKAGYPVPSTLTELRAADELRRFHAPVPVHQFTGIGRYRIDFAWPAQHVALEVDGWHHDRRAMLERDGRKNRDLARLGWLLVRIDPEVNGWQEHILRLTRMLGVASS